MSANHRTYEDYLNYLPKKEKKALEEAVFIEDEVNNATESIINQINRSKTIEPINVKKA